MLNDGLVPWCNTCETPSSGLDVGRGFLQGGHWKPSPVPASQDGACTLVIAKKAAVRLLILLSSFQF